MSISPPAARPAARSRPQPRCASYDAVVVGGGLAGGSLGIRLARAGVRVLVLEKQRYPAHKLCGEFLSTEVQDVFRDLGVLGEVENAGAHPIRRARLTAPGGGEMTLALPGTALGLSRYRLDPLLLGAARDAGAEALDGCSVLDVQPDGPGFVVTHAGGSVRADLVLGAHGKRSRLDGRLSRDFLRHNTPLVGFKAHFDGADVGDWIELHAFPGGYCGLSHIENGRVNVCWIAHQHALYAGGGTPDGMLEHILPQNPHLAEKLCAMRRVSARYEAVSQVTFRRKGLFDGGLAMVGDTAAMITPFCGDGMAMALLTAETIAPLAVEYLGGTMDRASFEAAYAAAWQARFRHRLALGRVLHEAFVRPALANGMVRAGAAFPTLARFAVRHTRG